KHFIYLLQQMLYLLLLSYLKQKDRPQLQFLRTRSDTNHLVIDRQYIEERKAIAEIQLGSIFSYLKNDDCRSRKLLSYFGETESADCLICDVCIQKRKAERNEELESKIYLQITHLLMDGPLTLDEDRK